jgi:hypothetical protein
LLLPGLPFAAEAAATETTVASSAAAPGDKCAPVYDETRTTRTEVDPRLATQLGALSAQGVTVHVQILEGPRLTESAPMNH